MYIQASLFEKESIVYEMFSDQIGVDFYKFNGWEVVSLNGISSLVFLKEYSNELGHTKDPNTRLNVT